MKGDKFTREQERFVDEHMTDTNGTQAVIRAGHSEHTASEQASRLLGNAKVATAISVTQMIEAGRLEWTPERVIAELAATAEEARADGEYEAAVQAWELIGRYIGMWPQRPVEVKAYLSFDSQPRVSGGEDCPLEGM